MEKGTKTLGQIAYEAWRTSTKETWPDYEIHEWDDLTQDDQAPFHAAATAVREAVMTNMDMQSFRDATQHLPQSVFTHSLAKNLDEVLAPRYPVLTAKQAELHASTFTTNPAH